MTRTQQTIQRAKKDSHSAHSATIEQPQNTLTETGFSSDFEPAGETAFSNKVTPGNILSLQRSIGNQAVQRMIQRQRGEPGSATGTIQRDDEVMSAPPSVGAYARGQTAPVNAPPPPPTAASSSAASASPVGAQIEAQLAAQTASDKGKFDAAYDSVMGMRGNSTTIESVLNLSMKDKIIPELSKSVLVKTRKDLTSDIKGDTHLYQKLGPDDATREAALEKLMMAVVTSVVGSLPSLQPVLESIKEELRQQAKGLPAPKMDATLLAQIRSLQSAKAWKLGLAKVELLDTQKQTYYFGEISRLTQAYVSSNGEAIVDTMNTYLEKRRSVKQELRAAFHSGVDERLGAEEVPPPPPFSADAEQVPPPPSGSAPVNNDVAPPPPFSADAPTPGSGLAYSTQNAQQPKYRKKDLNADGAQDYSEYGATGTGVTTAVGGVATKAAQIMSPVVSAGSAATQAAQMFGAGGGIAGVVSGGMETVRGIQDMSNSSAATGDRVMGGGGRTASGIASMVQQGGSAAYNIASLTSGATSAAALTGAAVAGGGGVAMGAVDMVRGGYGAYKAHQRQGQLTSIASQEDASERVKSAAMQAASTQEMRKKVAGATVLKGALLVAGGVTLLVLATNPVGWIIMGAAAVVGGLAALWRFWQKTKRKKEVAIRELGLEAEFKAYELRKAAAKGISRFKRTERNAAIAAVKAENPLHKKMLAMGYTKNNYEKFYADYIHDTAHVLHMNGVVLGNKPDPENQQMRAIVQNMGFEVNPEKATPTPEQIGKALNV